MNTNPIRVAFNTDDRDLRDRFERSGMVTIVDDNAEVVVWHIAPDADIPTELRALLADVAAPAIIAVTDSHPRWFGEALGLGIDDVLVLPQSPESLGIAAAKARTVRARRAHAVHAPSRDAHVFTVFSTKGGSGKTVIATNLAVCFAQSGKRTLLVDLDLHSGDDALVLGLAPKWTVLDLVQSPGELDGEKLAGFVTRHSSGLDLLPAPTRPDEEELVSIERLEPLLKVARETYDAIVIDTTSQFSAATLLAIDHTDTLILVGASDVPTIKSLKIALETLELLEMKLPDVRILMNRSGAKVGLEDRDVERTLKRQITYRMPSGKEIPVSVNHGQPVVLDAPKSRAAKCLIEMAASLETVVRSER
jgi:Flp pilus assembly CpaE family ATPase